MSETEGNDQLVAEDLRAGLEGCRLGNELVVVEETRSTNDLVWEAEGQAAREGFVVFAERQTAGRGQYGRRWESAPHLGLWFSVLLRPPLTLSESPQLTALLAKVLADTLAEETGCAATIKTPNDIYMASRKIAGVLVEGRTTADQKYVAVVGVGVNVNHQLYQFPLELQATAGSLRLVAGRPVDRSRLAIALLRKLDADYRAFQAGLVARNC